LAVGFRDIPSPIYDPAGEMRDWPLMGETGSELKKNGMEDYCPERGMTEMKK
jgi:hypothetical protein